MLFTFIFLILCANIYFVQSFRHVSFTNTLSKFGISRSIKLLDAQKFTSFEDMLTKMDKPVLVDFFAQW